MIPEGGRDVQCSSCGQTWFQPPATAEAAAPPHPEPEPDTQDDYIEDEVGADTAPVEDDEIPIPDTEDAEKVVAFEYETESYFDLPESTDPETTEVSETGFYTGDADTQAPDTPAEADTAMPEPEQSTQSDQPGPADEVTPATDPDEDPSRDAETAIAGLLAQEYDDEDPAEPAPPRRALDASVVNVLREEAALEQRARTSSDNDTLFGGQRDMGLESAGGVTALRHAGADDAATDAGSRRDLLPDIEEINSTLRATSERHGQFSGDEQIEPDHELEAQSGLFGRSFTLVILLAALLVAVYVFAPKIEAAFPSAKPALDVFVDGVDAGRTSLDNLLRSLVDKMTEGQTGAPQ